MPRWFEIPEDQFLDLIRLGRMYRRETIRCMEAKAYLAGCTCAGSAVEAMLTAMIHIYGDEVEAAGHISRRTGTPKPLLQWSFRELVNTATGMGWLPRQLPEGAPWNSRRAKIGDYVEVLRATRNLIHPARYLQDHWPRRITRRYLEQQLEVMNIAVRWLGAEVEKSLRNAL